MLPARFLTILVVIYILSSSINYSPTADPRCGEVTHEPSCGDQDILWEKISTILSEALAKCCRPGTRPASLLAYLFSLPSAPTAGTACTHQLLACTDMLNLARCRCVRRTLVLQTSRSFRSCRCKFDNTQTHTKTKMQMQK